MTLPSTTRTSKCTVRTPILITTYACNPLTHSFVQRTFKTALNHVQPDLIIFLGDIFDEGSISTAEEYERYLRRFHRIFQQHIQSIPVSSQLLISWHIHDITL